MEQHHVGQHTKQIVEQLHQGANKSTRTETHIAESTTRNNEIPHKMQDRMQKGELHETTNGTMQRSVHVNETGKRKAENTSPDQSTSSTNTPIEGEETNLVNRFNRQLHINENTGKLTVEDLIQNPQLARTDEERAKIREIKYYAEAAERAQYDTIKADPKDEEFLQVLEGVKRNCFNAYASAQKDLHKLLKRRKTDEGQRERPRSKTENC
jgi:hypothetical protein